MFNLKKAEIYQALKAEKNPLFRFSKFFRNLFLLIAFIFGFMAFSGASTSTSLNEVSGKLSLSLGLAILFFEISIFYEDKIKNPKIKRYTLSDALLNSDINLACFLDFEAAKACEKAIKKAKKLKCKEPSPEIFLCFICNPKIQQISFIFNRAEISFMQIRKDLKNPIPLTRPGLVSFSELIFEAGKIAQKKGKQKIGIGDILIILCDRSSYLQEFLILNNLKKQDIENLTDWYESLENKIFQSKRFWEYENLLKKGSIAKDWAAGYSIVLDRYCLDLRERLTKTGFEEIVGHEKEISQTERILEKEEINNVLLIGESGTGRGSIIKAIAQRAFLGKSLPQINYKRILVFDLGQLAAETVSFEEIEAVLEECFNQVVQAGNIILVIEGIENFLEEQLKPGTINISGILARYLPLSSFQIIAMTTYQGLHAVLEKNPSILNLFEKVEVSEISEKETLRLLENLLPFFERKRKRFISYKAIREILRLSSRYLADIPFPEKAVRLLDETISWLVASSSEKILKPVHIRKVVSEKIEIPLEDLNQQEKQILLNLEDLIHQRIINQEQAVKDVSDALRRSKAGIESRSGPIGGFLFLGPTGVGKTETAKALASVYFGSEKRMIRLDMSEFQEIKDIGRLIGQQGGQGFLTTAVRENPFSLVLLDEIEKAHPDILNLFLQVLDEGWLTDGIGRKIDFKNTIIIATSNAGAEKIRQIIKIEFTENGSPRTLPKKDLIDYLLKQGIFRPEFINRFDNVVVFNPLTKENLLLISQLMLNKLANNLRDKGIEFEITKEIKQKIVELSYSPEFGAREMKRVIQDKVENLLTQGILSDRLKRGNKVRIQTEPFSLEIT